MTIEQVKALSGEELRVKVAELCGWKKVEEESAIWNNVWTLNGKKPQGLCNTAPPLYHCDLSAMHEAERNIGLGQLTAYMRLLGENAPMKDMDVARDDWASCHATARQRAEAFVLTMEK
jgi:hypothetical protein